MHWEGWIFTEFYAVFIVTRGGICYTETDQMTDRKGKGMGKKESLQEKRQKMAEKRRRLRRRMRSCAQDILCSPNFRRSAAFCQHGRISVRSHSLMVAECSLQIRQKLLLLGIECRERELVRGALLHDYFLYDWHVKDKTHRLHGFFHPGTALANAQKEYVLSEREKNIILRHMWPLTPCPPACREAWIVTAADKYCSLRETLFLRRRRGA